MGHELSAKLAPGELVGARLTRAQVEALDGRQLAAALEIIKFGAEIFGAGG